MGFSLHVSISALTVFVQGLLSFFSPCVFPLIPLYFSYLTGQSKKSRTESMVNTVCFVLGISFAFFAIGFGVSAAGIFFRSHREAFARLGGVAVILLGLIQLGVFGNIPWFSREFHLPIRLDPAVMSPMSALLLGFTFSFAWTPCVGPALTSVLLMAASASSKAVGFLLLGVYTAGFIVPFLVIGSFASSLLGALKKHGSIVEYTGKLGAVLMIFMGILMLTGTMGKTTGSIPGENESLEAETEAAVRESQTENARETPAIDFTLKDQFGTEHTLSDYRGKVVFLNFWATWCHWCVKEMDDIQALYEEYQEAGDESVVILGIAAPGYSGEGTNEDIAEFLSQGGYTYPVVMDEGGSVFLRYGVQSYPTTFMIDKSGNVYGYAPGMLDRASMEKIIEMTLEGQPTG